MVIAHAALHSGDTCPECREGRVYRQKEPATLVRIIGQAPLAETVFEMGGCDAMPAARSLRPILEEFIRQAAQGSVLHNDETTMRILRMVREPGDKRTGIFTSGVISIVGSWRIALFFTGSKYAGENIAEVLKQRAQEPSPPQQALRQSRRHQCLTFRSNLLHPRQRVLAPKRKPLLAGQMLFTRVAVYEEQCIHARDHLDRRGIVLVHLHGVNESPTCMRLISPKR